MTKDQRRQPRHGVSGLMFRRFVYSMAVVLRRCQDVGYSGVTVGSMESLLW